MSSSLASRLLSLVVPPLCAVCREPELGGRGAVPGLPLAPGRASRSTLPALRRAAAHERCCLRRVPRPYARLWPCLVGVRVRGDGARHRGSTQGAWRAGPRGLHGATRSRPARPRDLLRGTLVPVPAHPQQAAPPRLQPGGSDRRRRWAARCPCRFVTSCDAAHAPAQVGLERRARLRNARRLGPAAGRRCGPSDRGARRRRLYDRSDPRRLCPGPAATRAVGRWSR